MRSLSILLIIITLHFSCSQNKTESKLISLIEERTSNAETECQRFEMLDQEMRDMLNNIRTKYQSYPEFIKKLNASQAYWIPYMNSQVRALYPKDWDRFYRKNFGRKEFNECKCRELSKLILTRIKDLSIFLESDSIDNCPVIFNE
ncbi:MAG TPA: hypothetical protein ACFCUD_02540 [Cyclobacteriaceae bacterium]